MVNIEFAKTENTNNCRSSIENGNNAMKMAQDSIQWKNHFASNILKENGMPSKESKKKQKQNEIKVNTYFSSGF